MTETQNLSPQIVLTMPTRWSDDEFYEFCRLNRDAKFERDKQMHIILMSLTGGKTGIKNSELTAELTLWNRKRRTGIVFDSSTGFRLPNGAVRSPDAAWILTERWNALTDEQQKKFPPLCPDFVIELMSESDRLDDLQEKMAEYLENGCKLAWLINPKTEAVWIYRAGQAVETVEGFDKKMSGEAVLENFVFDLHLLR